MIRSCQAPSYALNEIVDEHVDLTPFEARYANDDTGRLAYDHAVLLLIIGNTIRMPILSRRDEIEIIKLIGGTGPTPSSPSSGPFLYAGLLRGLFGAILPWLLLSGPAAVRPDRPPRQLVRQPV